MIEGHNCYSDKILFGCYLLSSNWIRNQEHNNIFSLLESHQKEASTYELRKNMQKWMVNFLSP
jgi:hypothetical protein